MAVAVLVVHPVVELPDHQVVDLLECMQVLIHLRQSSLSVAAAVHHRERSQPMDLAVAELPAPVVLAQAQL